MTYLSRFLSASERQLSSVQHICTFWSFPYLFITSPDYESNTALWIHWLVVLKPALFVDWNHPMLHCASVPAERCLCNNSSGSESKAWLCKQRRSLFSASHSEGPTARYCCSCSNGSVNREENAVFPLNQVEGARFCSSMRRVTIVGSKQLTFSERFCIIYTKLEITIKWFMYHSESVLFMFL